MNTKQAAAAIGVTYRQLHTWVTYGWLGEPDKHTPDRQWEFDWTRGQLETARVAGQLVRDGMQPKYACWYARHDLQGARNTSYHIGLITQTHGKPE